jgi:CRISPR-associated endonuclease/helicase Cas3/CRISPR-associated endonuclease Cas3-HD
MLSHSGIQLKEHLQAVAEEAARGPPVKTSGLRYIIGACHDFGKATTYFQEYLRGERSQSTLTNHSSISGLACFYALQTAGFAPHQCAQGWLAVTRHHSPLINTSGEHGVFRRVFYGQTAPLDAYDKQAKDISSRSETVQAIYDALGVPLDVKGFCEWVEEKTYGVEVPESLTGSTDRIDQPLAAAVEEIELFAQLVAADKLVA